MHLRRRRTVYKIDYRPVAETQVPLDKSEGVVKRYLSQAVREHRFFYQRG